MDEVAHRRGVDECRCQGIAEEEEPVDQPAGIRISGDDPRQIGQPLPDRDARLVDGGSRAHRTRVGTHEFGKLLQQIQGGELHALGRIDGSGIDQAERLADRAAGGVHEGRRVLRRGLRTTLGDVLGRAGGAHLATVQRRAPGPVDTVRTGGLADREEALQIGTPPRVDRESAVVVLGADVHLQQFGGQIDLGSLL
ncbi:hypothetical protein SDC9_177574 [bioreactor metagenome]|uniref:Uncharacterized protein n=1 Tax=bioreactor metagenome TaxID=1076179 RepID=A0A645GV33_9ZZZZ